MLEFVEIIQMAVAPAVLLTALGATLTVMANRLSRIVDLGIHPSRLKLLLGDRMAF